MYSKYILNNNINPNNNIVDLANFILYFDKIINFYNECGIKKFALENFEFLFN
jgi:oligo-1,6-glucosidase, probable membrane protein